MNPDITPLVRSWLDETISAAPGPVHLYEDVAVQVHQTPQQHGWLPPLPTRRFPTMFNATKFVAAAAIVALFGGFLLATVLNTQQGDEIPAGVASESPSPPAAEVIRLPVEIPDGIESGTLDTPLGPARWVHLQGDDSTLPELHDPVPAPEGFVMLAGGPPDDEPVLWRSPDLITWTPEALPVEVEGYPELMSADGAYWLVTGGPASVWRSTDTVSWEEIDPGGLAAGHVELTSADGIYWLATSGPAGLWRSSDASTWEEVDLSELKPPWPSGLDWHVRLGTPASSAGVTVVPVTYGATNAASYLGLVSPQEDDRGVTGLRESEPGVYTALDVWGLETATIRFEETDAGLRVVDAEDGTVFAELDGADIDFITRWAADDWLEGSQLGVVDGDTLVTAELPLWPLEERRFPGVFGTGAGFFAYVPAPDGLVRVWHSADGVTWTETESLGDDEGEPTDVAEIDTDSERVRLEERVSSFEEREDGVPEGGRGWSSSDGVTWDEEMDGDSPARFASGWLSLSTDALSFRRDGEEEWVGVDVTELGIKLVDGELDDIDNANGIDIISPNTVTHMENLHSGRRDIWIITFDALRG